MIVRLLIDCAAAGVPEAVLIDVAREATRAVAGRLSVTASTLVVDPGGEERVTEIIASTVPAVGGVCPHPTDRRQDTSRMGGPDSYRCRDCGAEIERDGAAAPAVEA